MNETIKKITAFSLSIELLGFIFFSAFEPVLLRAVSVQDQVVINQTVTSGISITSPSDITLTALSTTQNTAVASTTWTVITNNATGFTLSVTASGTPALRRTAGTDTFADYSGTQTGAWTTPASSFQFGFSAIGSKTTGYGSDPQSNCAAGTDVQSTTLYWKPFTGGTSIDIASSTATSTPSGVTTTLCVGDEQNGVFAPSGTYQATTTATAVTNP